MSSTLVTPLLIYRPFGASAANPTYINLPIPDASQIGITVNAASFADGFPPNTMTPEASGGLPFFGQDMNGILWMVSAYCANFAAGAFSKFNATLAGDISGYPVGAMVVSDDGGTLWINIVDGNSTNPNSLGANWIPFGAGYAAITLSNTDVTLTAAQGKDPYIALVGTLTGNVNVILPAYIGKSWVVSNSCAGAFTVTVKTATGSGVVVPATAAPAPTSVYCDGGANIQNTGVSTAGLAPINSPALTGTPTAPTAGATSNTTQIATTAMVQSAITAALSLYATLASPTFSGTPAAPTAAPGTNTGQLATTSFVQAAVVASAVKQKSGTFTCVAGVATVSFGTTFASPPRVFVEFNYASPDLGWVVPGSITTTGFQFQNGNSGLCMWFATLA